MHVGEALWWVLVAAVAIVLDVVVLRWTRRRWRPRAASGRVVYLWGSYSPVLTWLRERWPACAAGSGTPMMAEAPDEPLPDMTSEWPAVPEAETGDSAAPPARPKPEAPDEPAPSAPANPPELVVTPRPVETINVPLGPRLARVEIAFDLAPGERIQLVVEAAPSVDGKGGVVVAPVVVQNAPAAALPAMGQAPLHALNGAPPTAAAVPAVPVPPAQSPAAVSLNQWLRDAWQAGTARWSAWEARTTPFAAELAAWLFGAGLVVYLVTRLWGIDRFPIFFYSDEANNVLLGERVLSNGLRGGDGTWLPIYFQADSSRWTPMLWTYVEAVGAQIFGKTIFTARALTAVVSLGAALAVALLLRTVFQARFWWASPLLLALTPVWFLYSRTAWEFVLAAAFYAALLYCYARYRLGSPRHAYFALLAGAGAFYAYSNAQVVVVLLGLALLLTDASYHARHWRKLLPALPLAGGLAWPFIQFRWQHPTALQDHLAAVGSYWMQAIPLPQKLLLYASNYLQGLSPWFWFAPQNGETTILPAQHFGGQGHLGWVLLPLLLVGAAVSLRRLRASPPHRLVVLALLAAPASAALDAIEARRVLLIVVPAVILGLLGLEWLLSRRRVGAPLVTAGAVFGLGVLLSLAQLRAALVHGPTWTTEYGLYGLQYGVKPIFEDSLPSLFREVPSRRFLITTGWTNNVHLFPEFFLTPAQQAQVDFINLDDYLAGPQDLAPEAVFVLTAAEFERVQASQVLAPVETLRRLAFPDGSPAFVLARLAYTPGAAALFEAQALERQRLQEGDLVIDGQAVHVLYAALEDGALESLFDGDPTSWARGAGRNPYVLELHFDAPRALAGVAVKVGSTPDFTLTATVTGPEGGAPRVFSDRETTDQPDPTAELSFGDGSVPVSVLKLEITFNQAGPNVKIHLWEVALR